MNRARLTAGAIATPAIAAALFTAAPGWTAAPRPDRAQESDRAIVEVRTPQLPAGRSPSARSRWRELRAQARRVLDRFADRNDLEVAAAIPETGQIAVRLGGEGIDRLRRRLKADPRVERVLADGRVELRLAPNDPGFNLPDPNAPLGDFAQWHLRKLGGIPAWDLSRGVAAEVTVIDSGAYVAHPDLGGRVVGTLDCTGGCGGGSVSDSVGHGTHVSGLACADSNNGYGLASAGFDCNLFVIRIGFSSGSCSELAAGIVAAANRFTDAINLSVGGCGPELASPISYAFSRGSVPVVAADNDPNPPAGDYPLQAVQPRGTGPDINAGRGVVVTAAKYDGTRAAFAEATTSVSVAGFGAATDRISGGAQGILSTFPPATTPRLQLELGNRRTINGDSRFAYLVGTSMATPEVAGVVALMRSVSPSLSAARVARLLKLTAGNCATYGNGLGWGIVDAYGAVAAALGRDVDPPFSEVRSAKARRAKRIAAGATAGAAAARKGKRRGRITIRLKRFDGACSSELPISGVKTVNVFASVNGGKYKRIRKTNKKKIRFRGKPGRTYRFYSVAVDKAGNREARPTAAEAGVKLLKKKKRRR